MVQVHFIPNCLEIILSSDLVLDDMFGWFPKLVAEVQLALQQESKVQFLKWTFLYDFEVNLLTLLIRMIQIFEIIFYFYYSDAHTCVVEL